MQIRSRLTRLLVVVTGLACLVLLPALASADLFIFKDGFVIEGKIKKEGTVSLEGDMWIANGFFYVEDYSRRVFFSSNQVYDPLERKYTLLDPVKFYTSFRDGMSLNPIRQVSEYGEWNEKAERQVSLTAGTEKIHHDYKVTQHVIKLTPTIVEMQTKLDTPVINWFSCYLMRELGPEAVHKLLENHKDFEITQKTPKDEKAARRWKMFHFFAHTDWIDVAEKELDVIATDPAEKAEVDKNRAFLNDVKTQKLFDRIRRAYEAGQHERQKLIKEFPEDDIKDGRVRTDFRELRARYEKANKKLEQVRKLLPMLVAAIDDADKKKFFQTAIKSIEEELGHDEVLPARRNFDPRYVGRLENFIIVANPDKLLKSGAKIESNQAVELLSLAVTGWTMGNAAAEKNSSATQRLVEARQFLQDYLAKETRADRKVLIDAYQKRSTALTPEEFAYLISLLPPADPGDVSAGKAVEMQVPDRSKLTYLLRLPTEYRHERPYGYPVLFAMHDGNEEPKAMIERWGDLADEYGFILVAPKWTGKVQTTYNYSPIEHAAVLDVLRDLRKHYRVDSDRIFLHGLGEGASLAYDVGLSHPDLFAGLVPMSGNPVMFSQRYAANAQFLPIYAICGECCEPMRNNRRLFSPMGSNQFPVFLVTYRGRAAEFFAGEVPIAFDWMSRKSRAHPLEELGGKEEHFATLRETDNRFYWISADDIHPKFLNSSDNWKGNTPAANFHAKIKEKNFINVDVDGIKRMTLWFSDDGMVDFTKPLQIVVSPKYGQPTKYTDLKITSSLETLLDDFYARWDSKRLVLAKVEVEAK